MSPEDFRRHGHALIDWIADYRIGLEKLPVAPRVAPGEVRAALPADAPEVGEDFATVFRDLERAVLPGLLHWQSPSFFGYFPTGASYPSILGDLLSSGLGVQGMLWATSPAATELETLVLDQLADALALPPAFRSTGSGGGVIEDTASTGSLCALLAARERASGGRANDDGTDGQLTVYTSSQAHSSIDKAVKIAGFGSRQLRAIAVDEAFAMVPEKLAAAIRADRAAGLAPACVVATVGTTSSMAVDPLPAIGEICRREGIWLHVDAAMAGTAALCPELRGVHAGLELADSYLVNPHKWMLVNFDCTAFWVRDRASLVGALSVLPEYLKNAATASGAVFDYRDWQVPLGRRFRALKLWCVLRSYGLEALRSHVRRTVAQARRFAEWVAADDRFELAAPPGLALVCFRQRGPDEPNEQLLQRLNASGELFLSHTKLDARYVLRLALGVEATEDRHVEAAWAAIRRAVA
ncbi:MAG: pyridoxal-dependent decarboxylase [Thermoanaerobaculia bacterium]|nr:pyridoxal-dependent decarboxylase [Thermoanaerobaculia bacterium]